MFRHLNKMKGQSTLEYAVLIIIIIGALLSIQVYIKRGVQGRLKSATDDIGDQFSVGNTNVVLHSSVQGVTLEQFGSGIGGTTQGISKSTIQGQEKSVTNTVSNVINVDQEFWGKAN